MGRARHHSACAAFPLADLRCGYGQTRPRGERARFAHALIESLVDEEEIDEGLEASWAAEITRRAEGARAHPERLVPWDEVKAKLLRDYPKR